MPSVDPSFTTTISYEVFGKFLDIHVVNSITFGTIIFLSLSAGITKDSWGDELFTITLQKPS